MRATTPKKSSMLTRLMEVERLRDGAAAATGLSDSEISTLKGRILFEEPATSTEFKTISQIASQRKPTRQIFWLSGGIAAVTLLGFGMHIFLGAGKVTEPKVSFTLGQVQQNKGPLAVGTSIVQGADLTTGKDSILLIDQDQKIKTLISQNSGIQVRKISAAGSKPAVEIIQNKGVIFLSVKSGAAEATIQTGSAQVRVVGTQFSVTTTDQSTSVAVLEGTVRVRPDDSIISRITNPKLRQKASEEVPVKKGQRAIISGQSGSVTLQAISVIEDKYLKSLANALHTANDPAQNQTLEKVTAAIFQYETLSQTPIRLTLADIKRKFGKISRVSFSNGSSYVGFFTMQRDQIQIITPQGIVSRPATMLRDVRDAE